MSTENENAIFAAMKFEADEVNLDDLEQRLQADLEEKFEDLNFLREECEYIDNPDHLGETVMNVVWEQFMNQVAVTAGEDFIKENSGLTLDLRTEAHIQTTVASIRKHHQEAVHQLEDTLNDIMRDSDEFKEKINQVNDDLGELIK